jgi:hypothetical protein
VKHRIEHWFAQALLPFAFVFGLLWWATFGEGAEHPAGYDD